ncbi:MAG TPA: hypothetical protein DEG17_13885, partial [Cyanobacteria bacterium UBA11149]|nr:hypothetical protein [Cyanobacteria bacterium UBA11149]
AGGLGFSTCCDWYKISVQSIFVQTYYFGKTLWGEGSREPEEQGVGNISKISNYSNRQGS